MELKYEDEILTFYFPAPAAFEVDEDAFDFPEQNPVKTIILDFQNVKIISSLVISKIIVLIERSQNRELRFVNLGPELRNLLRRAGFASWLARP